MACLASLRYRIEQQRKRREALPAVLRAEAEEDDLALANGKFDQCRLACDLLRT